MFMRRLISVFFVLALAGCQTTAKPAPTADPSAVMVPGPDVPAEMAAFSGIWTGTWGGSLDGNLTVQDIRPDGSTTVVYAWGDHQTGRFKAGKSEQRGQITGNKLVLEKFGNGAEASYTLRSDGKLDGRYVLNGEVTLGVFTRI